MFYKLFLILSFLSLSLFGYDYYIPVVANTGGAMGSQWQSSLTLYNSGNLNLNLNLKLIPTKNSSAILAKEISLSPKEILSFENLLSEFSFEGSGSLVISVPQEGLNKLGIQSRIYNFSEEGNFGQQVPIIFENKAMEAPLELFLFLPLDEVRERYNFGIFSITNSKVLYQLLGQRGEILAEVTKNYQPLYHIQHNEGYRSFFQTDAKGYLIKAILQEGKVIIYGSLIDNKTNDGSFFLAENLKENEPPNLLGIDKGSDGTIDLKDENGDNILDSPIVFYEGYPFNYVFTILGKDLEGDPIKFKLLNPPQGMHLLSESEGKVYYDPSKDDISKTINLEVELYDGLGKTHSIIPLQVEK